jgi:hypothetical protein
LVFPSRVVVIHWMASECTASYTTMPTTPSPAVEIIQHVYIHTQTNRELGVVPDREHIRRTSNNILRLPRTFSPVKRCTGGCKWIREVSSDLPGSAVPLFI